MKKCILFMFFLIHSLNDNAQKSTSPDYIEIEYNGPVEHPVPNLVLSTENLTHDDNCDCFVLANAKIKTAGKKDSLYLDAFKYEFITIDKERFVKIRDFINSLKKFYMDGIKNDRGDYDIKLHINNIDNTHFISSKSEQRFFRTLKVYLIKQSAHNDYIVEIIKDYFPWVAAGLCGGYWSWLPRRRSVFMKRHGQRISLPTSIKAIQKSYKSWFRQMR